ncbi:type II toxin-antitoxin system RelE/ParE family toxin [Beijerinckia sp. L45]|uniref:type II toxin-antitoxin system RelE/ParE family toxin n=1 Tax=Beijerinckia sp. L45 TaxID=1641855 RepID=UPI00131D8800|nr:type II toxin-antitoxin system RelE/ParE family toxin [Beijerinckia sp. L45]
MRVFKTKAFARFVRREGLADTSLIEAANRAGKGLIDADLGGGLIKQRVARTGQGRRGGYRMLLAFRAGDRTIFLFGFAKSERDNIDTEDLALARDIAGSWLSADAKQIARAVSDGLLIEVSHAG